jgi:ABC-type multidrug transport system fused ATPase/permease subunit
VVGVLIMMFSISWQLALVALVSLPLMGVIFGVIGPKSQAAFGVPVEEGRPPQRARRGVLLGPSAREGVRP